MEYRIALMGNPNSGKTMLFNVLTGSNQKVANFPGVTVDKKEGGIKGEETKKLVDLPGIYSLSPFSMEEIVARDYLLDEKPDCILNIIDGTNLERNLYLTLQLLELNLPMVIAVNLMDELEKSGTIIDYAGLSRELGVQVIPISAKKAENVGRLMEAVARAEKPSKMPEYDGKTRLLIHNAAALFAEKELSRFTVMKLLEQDEKIERRIACAKEQKEEIKKLVSAHVAELGNLDEETFLPDARYNFIEELVGKTVRKPETAGKPTLTDKIDRVLLNRFWALPIFIAVMFFVFSMTFSGVGNFFKELIENFLEHLSGWIFQGMQAASAPEWTISLIVHGIIEGVGGILSFLPQIGILFFMLTLLEDSGYMARVAFMTDRLLRRIGLSGKSFIPMLMGFGCTTPAVMAARTLDNDKDRRMTIMLTPFMSCSAKLPIYLLFAGTFFPGYEGIVITSMYFIGILLTVGSGYLLKHTVFKGVFSPFVMELPDYRMPSVKSMLREVWEKIRGFLVKAGTIIFAMSVILWLLQNFDMRFHMVSSGEDSILAGVGKFIAPIFLPLGFGQWQPVVSLLSGLVAKEVVVSSMTVLLADGTDLSVALTGCFQSTAAAFSFMVFSLLYMPCISAFATIRKEIGGNRWALGAMAYQTLAAYVVAMVFYFLLSFIW